MKNIKASGAKKIYLAGVSFICVIAFLISLAVLVTGIVNLANPNAMNFYPRTFIEYRERFVKWNENGENIGYQFSDEEMRTMFAEEQAIEREIRRSNAINQIVISGVVVLVSAGLWAGHWRELKKG